MLVDVLKGCVKSGGTGTRAVWGDITVARKDRHELQQHRRDPSPGFTGYYACAVWVGSDYYKPLTTDADRRFLRRAPLWAAIMKKVHDMTGKHRGSGYHPQVRDVCRPDSRRPACAVSGMLPTKYCYADDKYGVTTDYYLSGTEPTEPCNMHRSGGKLYVPEGHPLQGREGRQASCWSTSRMRRYKGIIRDS